MKIILPLIFVGIPIAEIAMFIQVGDLIGLWPTLATIVITAIVGTAILRHQGLATIAKAQSSLDQGQLPLDSVIHGLFLLIAGVLLLTPGFLTDAVGFAFLVPPVRMSIAQKVLSMIRRSDNIHVHTFDMGNSGAKDNRTDRFRIRAARAHYRWRSYRRGGDRPRIFGSGVAMAALSRSNLRCPLLSRPCLRVSHFRRMNGTKSRPPNKDVQTGNNKGNHNDG